MPMLVASASMPMPSYDVHTVETLLPVRTYFIFEIMTFNLDCDKASIICLEIRTMYEESGSIKYLKPRFNRKKKKTLRYQLL